MLSAAVATMLIISDAKLAGTPEPVGVSDVNPRQGSPTPSAAAATTSATLTSPAQDAA
jgi:hypothetical protein